MSGKKNNGVGYGRPPEASQFKKGRSGNPRGRPKGSVSMANLLQEELDRKVAVTLDGKTRKMPKRQIAVRQQVDKAVKGCSKAFQTLMRLEAEGDAHTAHHERSNSGGRSEIHPNDYGSIVTNYLAGLMTPDEPEPEGSV